MDIFKFTNPNHVLRMERGEIINGLTSKTWIERYSEAGEFAFTAPASSDIRAKLPTGTFVSHINSTDLMIVENHEINEVKNQEAEVIVSGRGLEAYLEHRVVGMNKTFPKSSGVEEYVLATDQLSQQIRDLIRNHIYASQLIDNNNALSYIEVSESVTSSETSVERNIRQKDLYSAVVELLAEGKLGIKVFRPGIWSPATSDINIAMRIHQGVDRRSSVSFSHDAGEIDSADYFWTNRKYKNCALVLGRWVETTRIVGSPVGIDRRWMVVDASDIDQKYTSAPTGGTLGFIVAKMRQRGATELAKQKNIDLTKAEISNQSVRAQYRTDYDLGDIVSVEGNYDEETVRRVTEYVEIEDKTGRSSYPTLSEI